MMLPALRRLDAFPIEYEGQRCICLRDPEGFVEEQVWMSPRAFFIVAHLDGQTTEADIQYEFARRYFGELLPVEEIRKTVEYLDQRGFLQSGNFDSIRRNVEEAFKNSPVRPSYLTGKSCPADAEELRQYLEGMFVREGAPGEFPATAQAVFPDPAQCLIVPHIDFDRGGHSYAHGYLHYSRYRKPEVVIIFGVAHAGPPVPFVLTRKDFETPFGIVKTDQAIVSQLESACSWDPYQYEVVHRTEHSIEFQVLMLAYLFGTGVRIVPVLCSEGEQNPHDVLDACRSTLAGSAASISVICGADLAHVGKRFGDNFDIDSAIIRQVEQRDREDLHYALSKNAEGFYESVLKDSNARRVCGLHAIRSAIHVLDGSAPGELLHYGYAPDPMGGIVSFASAIYRS